MGLVAYAGPQSDVLSLLDPGVPPSSPAAEMHDPWEGTAWEGYCVDHSHGHCGLLGLGWWSRIADCWQRLWAPLCVEGGAKPDQRCDLTAPAPASDLPSNHVPTKAVPEKTPANDVPARGGPAKADDVLPLPPVPADPLPPKNELPRTPRDMPKNALPNAAARFIRPEPVTLSIRTVQDARTPVCSPTDYRSLTEDALRSPEKQSFSGSATAARVSSTVR
jgi:hypothetical protein